MDGTSVPKPRVCSKCGDPRQSHTCYCNACYATYNQVRRRRIRAAQEAALPPERMVPPGMRRCSSCLKDLPTDDFYHSLASKVRRCKSCIRRAANAAYVPKARKTPEQRFWERVDVRGEDECWDWIPTRSTRAYGVFSIGPRSLGAHRYAWFLAHGFEPGDLFVCHRCDRPCCVNAAHLFLGTTQDNNNDKIAKGREAVGEDAAGAKLTRKQVEWALAEHASGRSQNSIATELGVTRHCIWRLVHGHAWGRALGKRPRNRPLQSGME